MRVDTQFAKQSFTGLPPWAKGVIAVAIIGGIGFLIYKVVKVPGKIKEGSGNRQEDKAVNKDLDNLITSGKGPTLSKTQITQYANQLQSAMDGYGTDNAKILNIFNNVKNDADVLAIISAYGTRKLSSGTWNPEPNFEGTLGGALVNEQSNTEISKLNTLLSKKGIKHRF